VPGPVSVKEEEAAEASVLGLVVMTRAGSVQARRWPVWLVLIDLFVSRWYGCVESQINSFHLPALTTRSSPGRSATRWMDPKAVSASRPVIIFKSCQSLASLPFDLYIHAPRPW
jgi:hypothetical protein